MGKSPLIEVEERDMDAVLVLIRNISKYFGEKDDTVHMDYELEELIPEIVTIILGYKEPKPALFILFDAIATLVQDPDIQETVREITS